MKEASLKSYIQYDSNCMTSEKRQNYGKSGDNRGRDGWMALLSLNKLQEMVKDREAWCAAVHGVTNSWTRLSDWTEQSLFPCGCRTEVRFPHIHQQEAAQAPRGLSLVLVSQRQENQDEAFSFLHLWLSVCCISPLLPVGESSLLLRTHAISLGSPR